MSDESERTPGRSGADGATPASPSPGASPADSTGAVGAAENQLDALRAALRKAEAELQRTRLEAESKRHLVDIMHEVMGNLSTEEIFHMVARRLARAAPVALVGHSRQGG